ncbi:MAG: dienelactone hydrolase family protein [Acidobacteriota bacterium]|nr:dienelactone hydrolase family protein [Acidobacteriota bacterium]MDH3523797.1 dienelactone hydrolase family protein [Acidobacteriota bacterium]
MHRTLRTVAVVLSLTTFALACAAGQDSDAEYAARMAAEHEGDEPVAAAAAGDQAAAVATEEVAYWPGTEVEGYLARPAAGAARGGILVIQEWWGLNDNIRTMARRFAEEGYVALAVDLYEGGVAETRDEAMALMGKATEQPGRLEENLRAAHAYLRAAGVDSIGAVGWCFGGGWALRTAILLGDELDAAVVYYGRVVTDDELAAIGAPVLGHFGSEDGGIPIAGVRAFEARMQDLGKEVTVYVYEGADHAFANPSGTRYDAAAAELAWDRTLDFFAAHVGS